MKAAGKRLIISGLLIAGVALLFTLASYSSASDEGGGGYFILWGPVLYGLYRAFRGFLLFTSAPAPRASENTKSSSPTQRPQSPVEDVTQAVQHPASPSLARSQALLPAPATSDATPPDPEPLPQPDFGYSRTPGPSARPPEPSVHEQSGDHSELRRCPHCAEEIQPAAATCRFCGRSTKPPANRLALWSLLVNLLGVPIGSIAALILGYRALGQIREQEGRQGGRGLAIAGIVWGWGALAVVGVVLLVLWISAATKVPLEEVRQEAANVAFAERTFAETHGRFTSDLAELGYRPSGGIDVHVVTTPEEDKFCVDAASSDYAARTWDSRFRSDGVLVAAGLCQGPVRPGSSPEPPSWLDTSPVETEEPATPTPSPSPIDIRTSLFVPSPSADRMYGHGIHACGGANPSEVERSWAEGERLVFSTHRAGRDFLGAATTSYRARLAYLRIDGKLTCGWQARFTIHIPRSTRTFFIYDEGLGWSWGPFTPSEARALFFTYVP